MVFDRYAAPEAPLTLQYPGVQVNIVHPDSEPSLIAATRRLRIRHRSYSTEKGRLNRPFSVELMGGVEQISNFETVEISRKERRPSHGVSKSVSKRSAVDDQGLELVCMVQTLKLQGGNTPSTFVPRVVPKTIKVYTFADKLYNPAESLHLRCGIYAGSHGYSVYAQWNQACIRKYWNSDRTPFPDR